MKETSQTKLFKKLGLESLKYRRWFGHLCTFLKVKSSGKTQYLLNLIPTGQHETYYCRTGDFKNSFFP